MENESSSLREKAEQKLPNLKIQIDSLTEEQIKETIHELNVHQIELELQNEELRETYQNLETKKDQYFKLFNNAPNGYAILDKNGIILKANNKLQEIFSTELSKILNIPFNSFLSKESSNKFLGVYRSFFSNPNEKIFNFNTNNKHLTVFGKLDNYFPSQLEGDVLLLTVIDNTEIEIAHKQIEKDAKLYSSIIHNSLEGFWLIDRSGRIVDVNNTACKMVGFQKNELIEMSISKLSSMHNSLDINELVVKSLDTHEERFKTKLKRKDGYLINVEICPSKLLQGDGELVVLFIRDITQEVITNNIFNKRLELIEYSTIHSTNDTIKKALDIAEELTNSQISFWHHLDENENKILMQQWSTNTIENNCKVDGFNKHLDVNEAGIWSTCIKRRKPMVIDNYKDLESDNILPEGHSKLKTLLIVPIFKSEKIVAIIGVGNKAEDYVEEDIKLMQTFGDVAWTVFEKKYANESLVKVENKNSAILGLLPDLLFEISDEGVFLNYHVSDYSKLFLPPEKFMNKNILDVLPIETSLMYKQQISKALKGKEMVSFEYSSFINDSFQYFTARIVQFTSNSVLCFLRDITEKQIAKELIIESEEKFSSVFFNSPLIKSIIDIRTDQFVDINNQFIKSTGFTKAEALNHTATEIGLLSPEERKKILKELDEKGKVRNLEVEYKKKNGEKIICNYSTELLKISGKTYVLNTALDITEKYNFEKELEAYKNELENKVVKRTNQLSDLNRTLANQVKKLQEAEETVKEALRKEKELHDLKTQFISMASHEFRTPLTTILSSSELIEDYIENDDKEKILHNTNKIQNSVNKMISLIEEVLTLSRENRTNIQPEVKSNEISSFVSTLLEDVEVSKQEGQIINSNISLDKAEYNFDPKIVNHVLSNLLINAVKYSGPNSEINFHIQENTNKLEFKVEDNGPGIKEKDLENLFEPFYRSEDVRNIQGSGLGLTIAKNFVEMHNGDISVESEINRGTKFLVKIPLDF